MRDLDRFGESLQRNLALELGGQIASSPGLDGHRSVHHGRADAVRSNVVLAQLQCHHLGHRVQGALATGVDQMVLQRNAAGLRRNADDRTLQVLLEHLVDHALGDVDQRLDVHVENELDVLQRHLADRGQAGDAGVVDQMVHVVVLQVLVQNRLGRVPVGEVHAERVGGRDVGLELVQRFLCQIDGDDSGVAAGQVVDDGTTDALAGAGDQDSSLLEVDGGHFRIGG